MLKLIKLILKWLFRDRTYEAQLVRRGFGPGRVVVSSSFPKLAKGATEEIYKNLLSVVTTILEPLEEQFGPLAILSGYRSPELNAAVKGARDSDHLYGLAIDFYVPGHDLLKEVIPYILEHLEYRQLIFYVGRGFVHVSTNHPDRTYKKEYFFMYPDGSVEGRV